MARDVNNVLVDIIADKKNFTQQQAMDFIKSELITNLALITTWFSTQKQGPLPGGRVELTYLLLSVQLCDTYKSNNGVPEIDLLL